MFCNIHLKRSRCYIFFILIWHSRDNNPGIEGQETRNIPVFKVGCFQYWPFIYYISLWGTCKNVFLVTKREMHWIKKKRKKINNHLCEGIRVTEFSKVPGMSWFAPKCTETDLKKIIDLYHLGPIWSNMGPPLTSLLIPTVCWFDWLQVLVLGIPGLWGESSCHADWVPPRPVMSALLHLLILHTVYSPVKLRNIYIFYFYLPTTI